MFCFSVSLQQRSHLIINMGIGWLYGRGKTQLLLENRKLKMSYLIVLFLDTFSTQKMEQWANLFVYQKYFNENYLKTIIIFIKKEENFSCNIYIRIAFYSNVKRWE